jgi:hypothetical protein
LSCGFGLNGGLASSGVPITHVRYSCRLAGHVHRLRSHVHGMTHEGMVLSMGQSLWVHTLLSVKQLVAGCGLSVLTSALVALLWQLVIRLFVSILATF